MSDVEQCSTKVEGVVDEFYGGRNAVKRKSVEVEAEVRSYET